MSIVHCPTCNKAFDSLATRSMPFCSERCRKIDLNRWLSEEISMPRSDEAEDDGPKSTERDDES